MLRHRVLTRVSKKVSLKQNLMIQSRDMAIYAFMHAVVSRISIGQAGFPSSLFHSTLPTDY